MASDAFARRFRLSLTVGAGLCWGLWWSLLIARILDQGSFRCGFSGLNDLLYLTALFGPGWCWMTWYWHGSPTFSECLAL